MENYLPGEGQQQSYNEGGYGGQQQPFKEQSQYDSPYSGQSEEGGRGLNEGRFGTSGGYEGQQQHGYQGGGYERQGHSTGMTEGGYGQQQGYGGMTGGGYQQPTGGGYQQQGYQTQEGPYGGRTESTYAEGDTFSSDLSTEGDQRKHKNEGIMGKIEGALGMGDEKKHGDDGSSSSSDEEDNATGEKKKKHHFL